MCIQDMASGRRMVVKQTTGTTTALVPVKLPANPARLRVTVMPQNGVGLSALSTRPDTSGVFAYSADGQFALPVICRVEEYGQAIMGDIYIITASGTDLGVVVTELLADSTLDPIIQKVF